MGARGPLWARFVLFWEPSGLPLGASGSTFVVRRILHFIWGFILFSAARVLSWLSWPPSGCLGPVPLALRGRSEGPVSLSRGSAFSVFLIIYVFFQRPSFFKLPRGVKGGSRNDFGAIVRPPKAPNGPFEGPFSVTNTPRNNLNLISVEFQGKLFDGLYFFGEILINDASWCKSGSAPGAPKSVETQ